jgi:undecaprenyl-diphosphatase
MNKFDLAVLTYLNSFANRYPAIDAAVTSSQGNNLLKGGILIAVWWYYWFRDNARATQDATQAKLLGGLVAMVVGLFVARIMAATLPFRMRPFSNPELHFVIPHSDGSPPGLTTWSSFPSDHAVVWFSIAATIFLIGRRTGWLMLAYVSLLSLLRVYSGYHHPTDILAGAVLAIVFVKVFTSEYAVRKLVVPVFKLRDTRSGIFYALLFLATFEMASMFNGVRALGKSVLTMHP